MKVYVHLHPQASFNDNEIVIQDAIPYLFDGCLWTDKDGHSMTISNKHSIYNFLNNMLPKDVSHYIELEL